MGAPSSSAGIQRGRAPLLCCAAKVYAGLQQIGMVNATGWVTQDPR